MSEGDPKRLLDLHRQDDRLGKLLSAGKSEVPTDAQMLALAAKIGVIGGLGGAGAAGALGGGSGAAAGGAGGAGGVGASAGAGAGAGAKVAAGVTAAKAGLAMKIGGAVVVASAFGTSAVVVTKSHRAEEPKPPVGIVATISPQTNTAPRASSGMKSNAVGATSRSSDLRIMGTIDDDDPPVEGSASPANATTSARHAQRPAPSAAEGPEAEVRLLERAQDALRSRPAEALALADDHARRFPQGMLAQEREVIAIEALVKTGRMAEAKARAARFKARFPGSSHTRRIEALVGG